MQKQAELDRRQPEVDHKKEPRTQTNPDKNYTNRANTKHGRGLVVNAKIVPMGSCWIPLCRYNPTWLFASGDQAGGSHQIMDRPQLGSATPVIGGSGTSAEKLPSENPGTGLLYRPDALRAIECS